MYQNIILILDFNYCYNNSKKVIMSVLKRKVDSQTDSTKKIKEKLKEIKQVPKKFTTFDLQNESILCQLPSEILRLVLIYLALVDLDSFGRTCKKFYNIFTTFLNLPIDLMQISGLLHIKQTQILEKRKFIWLNEKRNEIPVESSFRFFGMLENLKVSFKEIILHPDCFFLELEWAKFICLRHNASSQILEIKTEPVSLTLAWLSIARLRYFFEFAIDRYTICSASVGQKVLINGEPLSDNEYVSYEEFAQKMNKIIPSPNFVKIVTSEIFLKEPMFTYINRSESRCFYNSIYFVFLRYIEQRFKPK